MGGSGTAADNAINKLRTKLATRGARGFIGI
jgi:Ca2+-binding EF-hand superfamily protein